jgi:HD-GYP domain-containing protein (c-di-GMP phosphodiesterase class II)
VYFAALLHDVGKIGIRDDIINKVGELTDEEYEQIKRTRPWATRSSPASTVSVAARRAHYHHERYDGPATRQALRRGHPRSRASSRWPTPTTRMTSGRSYRDALPEQMVRDELSEGMGRQFDPRFAEILLRILDRGGE